MKSILFVLVCLISINIYSQDSLQLSSAAEYLIATQKKSQQLSEELDQATQKCIRSLDKLEGKILKKLKDSTTQKSQLVKKTKHLQNYNPDLDTLQTVVYYLQTLHPDLSKELLRTHTESFNELSNSLQYSADAESYISDKIQYIKSLVDLNQLDKGLLKKFKEINKLKYYYSQEIQQYKDLLKDRKKVEKKLLNLLKESKMFQDFSSKHSWFNSLFPSMSADLTGVDLSQYGNLQSNQQISNLIQSQLNVGGENAQSNFQQQMGTAQEQISQVQNRLYEGWGSGDEELPAFKPNSQKTKSFLDRLEYSFNMQNNRSNQLYPTYSNISLGVGYKLSDNSIVGVLGNYQLGLGKLFNDIKFSNQGLGGSAYAEIKLKGSFWIYSAYESNYKFESNLTVIDYKRWINSAYVGLSKRVLIKNQFFNAVKIQLLWDFLARKQYPTRQELNFRVSFVK